MTTGPAQKTLHRIRLTVDARKGENGRRSRKPPRGRLPWQGDDGATLVTALLAMLVLSAIAMMVTITVTENMQMSRNHYEAVTCLYISEAGLSFAVQKLDDDPAWTGIPAPGQPMGGGRFRVVLSDSTFAGAPLAAGQKRMSVVASINGAQREIEVIVQ